MAIKKIKIGTRGSPLALAQTGLFVADLKRLHPDFTFEVITIKTSGDKIQDRFLAAEGGKGLFTKEIEEALLAGEIDLAVHSLKDVPAKIPEDLELACFPRRLSHEDVLVTPQGLTLEGLPSAATIGTVSLRRRLQLARRREDLQFAPLRGNIDTRIRRLNDGEFTAIVLAQAGLIRLGLKEIQVRPLGLIPAPGQGCLAIEINSENNDLRNLLKEVHDPGTERAVLAERRVMEGLGGDCNLPLGALALVEPGQIRLKAFIASPDGADWIEEELCGNGDDPMGLADRLLKLFEQKGSAGIIQKIKRL